MRGVKGPDLRFENQFSIVLVRPLTVKGSDWIKERLIVEDWQRVAGAIAVDSRSAVEIFNGARTEGLILCAADYPGEVEQV